MTVPIAPKNLTVKQSFFWYSLVFVFLLRRNFNNNNKKFFISIITSNQIERNIAEDNIIEDIRNLFRLKKENDIKDKIIRDIRTLFESDEEDYYKPVRIGTAFSSNYIEYESNGDKEKHYQ